MNADRQAFDKAPQPSREEVDLAIEVFQMLGDATRFLVLLALVDGELPVSDLAQVVDKPATGVSQHLAKLRLSHLVRTRRDGTRIFYRLENDHVRQLIVDVLNHVEHMGPSVPRHHQNQALPLSRYAVSGD